MDIDVHTLNLLLKKLTYNKVFKNKARNKKTFRVDKIVGATTRSCVYAGGKDNNESEIKTHLQVKFTSPDENGIICVSVLLDKYRDLFQV